MENVLKLIVDNLVDEGCQYTITKEETDRSIDLTLKLPEDQMGRVIGKRGSVAKAIRLIANSSYGRDRKKVYIKIESENE